MLNLLAGMMAHHFASMTTLVQVEAAYQKAESKADSAVLGEFFCKGNVFAAAKNGKKETGKATILGETGKDIIVVGQYTRRHCLCRRI